MSKVLVTGGAGYIGSHVLNQLKNAGRDVIVIDNLSTGRRESVLHGELLEINLEDREKVKKVLKENKFESCLHFAGSIIVPESVREPIKYYNNNTINSLNLIEECISNGIKNFIFSSTAAVYGLPESGECSETTFVNPINPYGNSKLMTELMLKDACSVSDMNYIALRYFNVAGANNEGKLGQCSKVSTHLIKIACETALGKRDSMELYGDDYDTPDGTCIRDYIHVDDLAKAHIQALNYLEKGGESDVFNCGYGHGYSVKEVIDVVKKVSGIDFKVNNSPRRDGDAPLLTAKSEKIRETLDWKPEFDDLELIVKTALEWEKTLG